MERKPKDNILPQFPEDYMKAVSFFNPNTGQYEPRGGDIRLVLWAFKNLIVDSRIDKRLILVKDTFYNSNKLTIEKLKKKYGPDIYTCLRGNIICLKWFNTLNNGYIHSLYVIIPGEHFGVDDNGDHDFGDGEERRTIAEKYFQNAWDRENATRNAGEINLHGRP